jgi:hypothetical protein
MHQNKKKTMLRKIGIVIIAILLFQSFMIKDDSFTKYCQYLKRVDLPIIFDCEQNINYPDYSGMPESLDARFRPEGHKTLGKIDFNENIISIIQVAQAENEFPMIFNYRKDGSPIDTVCLLSGSCSSCPEYATHSMTSIGFDKKILMTDSSFYFKIAKDGDRLKLDSIVIFQWKIEMSNDGHFKEILINKEKKKNFGA